MAGCEFRARCHIRPNATMSQIKYCNGTNGAWPSRVDLKRFHGQGVSTTFNLLPVTQLQALASFVQRARFDDLSAAVEATMATL